MKLFEYEGKEFFRRYGIPVPRGIVARSVEDVARAVEEVGLPAAIKAQVLVGARGKAGGIRIVSSKDEAVEYAERLFREGVAGTPVSAVLVEEAVKIGREFYLSFTVDRSNRGYVLLSSTEGGVDIEEIARRHPEKILRRSIDPFIGLRDYDVRAVARFLGLGGEQAAQLVAIVRGMYRMFTELDADLVEINPLALDEEGRLIALDSKVIIDDNALYRQEAFRDLERVGRDLTETEVIARKYGFSYVELDGDIGIIGNGAGLTMATMDMVSLFGGRPANFLDIGGGARRDTVREALKLLLNNERVKAVFVNIFGGITRCDEVATGIVEALKETGGRKPLVIRLVGTNEEEGRRILEEAGIECFDNDEEAARRVVALARGEAP